MKLFKNINTFLEDSPNWGDIRIKNQNNTNNTKVFLNTTNSINVEISVEN